MELNNEEQDLTPRLRLGRRLRRLREQKGLSLRQLSEVAGNYSHSYLGRVELGEQLPSEALATALDEYFGTDGVLSELLELAHDGVIPDYSRSFISKEPKAERIQVLTSSLVPGLLQTEDYMREIFRTSLTVESDEHLAEKVAFRLHRQRIFERSEPPYYWAIMDEAALRRSMGGPRKMAAQMRHLLAAAASVRTTVQVISFDRGAHPVLGGSLTLLTLADGGTLALAESFTHGHAMESTKRVVEMTQRFDLARSLALTPDESLDLINKYLKDYQDAADS